VSAVKDDTRQATQSLEQQPGGTRRRRSTNPNAIEGNHSWIAYLFSGPSIVVVALLLAFPVLYGVYQSLFAAPVFGAEQSFVGLQNYVEFFQSDRFFHALRVTTIFVTGCIVVGISLGLIFAFALNRVVSSLRFLRGVAVAPYLVSNVAAAVMFRLLFNAEFGLINRVIEFFGLEAIPWLSNPTGALVVVILAQVWTDLPLTILLLLAGLQTIDHSYMDAALVDGATGWKRARYLSIPLIAPQIAISTVWMSYSTLTGLGVVLALTGGGPLNATQTLPMEMYIVAFDQLEMNQALAIATFILVLNAVLTMGYVALSRRYGMGD
jgi:ABC-type sugar transport system permease subunit